MLKPINAEQWETFTTQELSRVYHRMFPGVDPRLTVSRDLMIASLSMRQTRMQEGLGRKTTHAQATHHLEDSNA